MDKGKGWHSLRLFVEVSLALFVALGFAHAASADEPVFGAHTEPAWRALYWNNTTLSGQPVLYRDETILDHNWGRGSPDASVNADNFSARWTQVIETPKGRFRFSVTGDDGVRVYVDGERILNGWWDHGVRTFTTERDLNAGDHEVRVEFYERGGVAVVKFSMQPVSVETPGATPTPTPIPDSAWRGQYFNNKDLSGAPALTRDDAAIDFDWGDGSPDPKVNADGFSVRWTKNIHFQAGKYRFLTETDDGVRVYVDGERIIDEWRNMSGETQRRDIHLDEGVHEIRMEYFENAGSARAKLTITTPDPRESVGNLITCVPPNPPNYAWIRVYRKDAAGNWVRALPKGVGSIVPSGYLKIDGLPVDIDRFGDKGEPYWIEQWIDGKVARSVGNTDRGEPEFRIRPNADNHTSWPCERP